MREDLKSPTASPRRLASPKDAKVYACMGRTKLYEKIAAGEIVAYRREGKTLVDLDSIDAYNERQLRPWKGRAA